MRGGKRPWAPGRDEGKRPSRQQNLQGGAARWAGRPGGGGGGWKEGPGAGRRRPARRLREGANGTWARPGPRPARPPAALPAGPPPLTPSRHTLSSLSAMAWEPGARARRRPKLRRERPGPARASPSAAAARPSPGRGARRGGGRPFAGPRPGPSVTSRAGPASAAGTVPRVPKRHRRRHLGTPAGSPDLPAHLGSHLRREGGAGWRREARGGGRGGGAADEGRDPKPDIPASLLLAPPLARRPRLQAHSKMAGEWGWTPGAPPSSQAGTTP